MNVLQRLAAVTAAMMLSRVTAVAAQQQPVVPTPVPAAPRPADAPAEERAPVRRPSRDLIDEEEIIAHAASHPDVHSLVSSMRPSWLRVRRTSINLAEEVRVYRDGVAMGGPAALRQIPTHTVSRVERLDSARATTRFGTGHGSGAVLVFTRS